MNREYGRERYYLIAESICHERWQNPINGGDAALSGLEV